MHSLNSYKLLLVVLFFAKASILSAQEINIGIAVRENDKPFSLRIESNSPVISNTVRRAFELHGGYALTTSERAAYTFKIEKINDFSVELTILSGIPAKKLYGRTVKGRDLQDAIFRTCDIAVEATLQIKGFFAGKLAYIRTQQGVSEIYTSDLLFNRIQPLTADRALVASPDWSPDGTKLIYTTYFKTGFPDIYMTDISNNRRIAIANFGGTNSSPAFSPNGQRIAMSLSGKGNSDIFISNADGKNLRPITRNKSIETSPSWSPDGRWLVIESDMRGKPQLYEVASSGGPMRRLPTNISGYCSEPAWNPVDKDLIAFTAAIAGGFQIVIYNKRTQKSEQITSVPGSAVEPEWLNDGRHLVFTQKQNGTKRLMILDSKTKKVSALHRPNFGDTSSATFVY
jgi:TolB protein